LAGWYSIVAIFSVFDLDASQFSLKRARLSEVFGEILESAGVPTPQTPGSYAMSSSKPSQCKKDRRGEERAPALTQLRELSIQNANGRFFAVNFHLTEEPTPDANLSPLELGEQLYLKVNFFFSNWRISLFKSIIRSKKLS
jgi:hypothetical protein